jgi:hypothetical protein
MDTPSNIPSSDIRNFLVRRLGEKEAAEIMDYINAEIHKALAEKDDASRREIALWRAEMKDQFATKEDAGHLEKKLIRRVSAAEGTLIVWSFVFWITLIIAVYILFRFLH